MKPDKYQQFVKDGGYDSDLSETQCKLFMQLLSRDHWVKFDDVCSNVNGSIDMSDIIGNSINLRESITIKEMDQAIKTHVNELIKTTLEEIEDIEETNKMEVEPEDPMDTIVIGS